MLPAKGLIDEWISYPSEYRGAFSDRLGLLWKLRRGRYDTLVYLAPRRHYDKLLSGVTCSFFTSLVFGM